jgi:hypothetical protein
MFCLPFLHQQWNLSCVENAVLQSPSMATVSLPRRNAREIAIGAVIAAGVSIAASSCVLLFDLHPGLMGFGMILGMGIGQLESRRLMSERLARVRDQKRVDTLALISRSMQSAFVAVAAQHNGAADARIQPAPVSADRFLSTELLPNDKELRDDLLGFVELVSKGVKSLSICTEVGSGRELRARFEFDEHGIFHQKELFDFPDVVRKKEELRYSANGQLVEVVNTFNEAHGRKVIDRLGYDEAGHLASLDGVSSDKPFRHYERRTRKPNVIDEELFADSVFEGEPAQHVVRTTTLDGEGRVVLVEETRSETGPIVLQQCRWRNGKLLMLSSRTRFDGKMTGRVFCYDSGGRLDATLWDTGSVDSSRVERQRYYADGTIKEVEALQVDLGALVPGSQSLQSIVPSELFDKALGTSRAIQTRELMSFDACGRQCLARKTDGAGAPISSVAYAYSDDAHGNWVKRTCLRTRTSGGESTISNEAVVLREIQYW